MSRDPRLYLADIVEACRRVERFAAGRHDDQVMSDEIVRDAILYNIVVIGSCGRQSRWRSGIRSAGARRSLRVDGSVRVA